jgi:hypothetical protein
MPTPETAYVLGHADEWADWTPAGAEEAADIIKQLVAQRDGLVKALSAASEEISACAEIITDGEAKGHARMWARKALAAIPA